MLQGLRLITIMKILLENWKRYINESEESNVPAGRIYDLVFDIKGEVYNRSIKAPKFFTETEAEKESKIVFDEMKAKGLIDDFKTYQAFVIAFNKLTDPKEDPKEEPKEEPNNEELI